MYEKGIKERANKIVKKYLEYKSICWKIALCWVPYFALYKIKAIRNILEYILLMFVPNIDTIEVVNIYFIINNIYVSYIILFVLANCACYLYLKAHDKTTEGAEGETVFERSLLSYLNSTKTPRCYLITGIWGSGKTYLLKNFLEKYYSITYRKIYRISCFGLSTRKELINEINRQIEDKDNGIYRITMDFIKDIPVIGKMVYQLSKRYYNLDTLKEGSIFIFDDFERVTSRGTANIFDVTGLYKKSSFMFRSSFNSDNKREHDTIEREFKAVQAAFDANKLKEIGIINHTYLEKYNAIVGCINELIEEYKMKVIVICNSDVIGQNYLNNVFRGKLDCITYYKKITDTNVESSISKVIDDISIDSVIMKDALNDYLKNKNDEMVQLCKRCYSGNLRLMNSFLHAFIDTVIIFSEEQVGNIKLLDSLFYSIFTVHYLDNYQETSVVDIIPTGSNISFFVKLYDMISNEKLNSIYLDKCSPVHWAGNNAAGYWILNKNDNIDIEDCYNNIFKYPYFEFEKELLSYTEDFRDKELCLDHVLYIIKYYTDLNKSDYENMLSNVILTDRDSKASLNTALMKINNIDTLRRNEELLKLFFKKLNDTYGVDNADEYTYTHIEYNDYLSSVDDD